jgi:hypothetical protein
MYRSPQGLNENVEKLIKMAHDAITRRKGKDYAPDVHELQAWIDNHLKDKNMNEAEEKEEDLLDMAWGLEATSRLSCQALVGNADLIVEIPKYTINHARENH